MNKNLLLTFVDKVVKIDRGGPESRVGKVLSVEDDHIAVITEDDGVIYYNTHHIKSLTNNSKQDLDFALEVPENFVYYQARSFKDVLNDMTHHWVQINRGGPEMLEGVLEHVTDEYVIIVSGEEVVRVSKFHLRNISYGVKIEKPEVEEVANTNKNNTKQNSKKKEEKAKVDDNE